MPLPGSTSRIDVDAEGNRVSWRVFDQDMRARLERINQNAVRQLQGVAARAATQAKRQRYLRMNCGVEYRVTRMYDGSYRLDVTSLRPSGDAEFDQWVREELTMLNGKLPPFPAMSRAQAVAKSVIIGFHQGDRYSLTEDEFYY